MTIEAELHQTIGGLKSTVDHLAETVKHMVVMWTNQEHSATEGRRLLYEKVEALKDSVNALGGRVGAVETVLTDVKPAVEEFKTKRAEQRGAMKLGNLMWGGLIAASGGLGYWLHQLFTGAPIPPPGH